MFVLILYLVFLAVSFWATTRIITQAGYSPAWILMPLSSLVLSLVVFVMLFVDLRTLLGAFPFGIGGTVSFSEVGVIEVLWHLDMLTILANWILFLIFAFSRWPFAGDPGQRGRKVPVPQGGAPTYGRHAPDPSQPSGTSTVSSALRATDRAPSVARELSGDDMGGAGAPGAVAGAHARPARTKHCVWCGEPLPGSRALFHDCGTKDRPATNCAACGAVLASDGATCLACAAGP